MLLVVTWCLYVVALDILKRHHNYVQYFPLVLVENRFWLVTSQLSFLKCSHHILGFFLKAHIFLFKV